MLVITLLSCSHRTLRRTTTCTSTQCTGSLLNWTNTPLTGRIHSSVYNFPQPLEFSLKIFIEGSSMGLSLIANIFNKVFFYLFNYHFQIEEQHNTHSYYFFLHVS